MQGGDFRPGLGFGARRVLLGIFRGGSPASAPPPPPPALLRRPARGRHGTRGAHLLACRSPLSSFRGWSPGRRDLPEPRRCGPLQSSQALQTLTHSCPEGRRWPDRRAPELACLRPSSASLSWGWGPGEAGRRPGEKPGSWTWAPSAVLLCSSWPRRGRGARVRPGPQPRRGLLRSEGGVRSWDLIAGAEAGRPLPGAPGAREGAVGGGAWRRPEEAT